MCINLKDFCLGTPMNRYEYMCIKMVDILGYIGHFNPHILVPIHGCAKVKILEFNTHESATFGWNCAVEQKVGGLDFGSFGGGWAGII